MRRHHAWKRSSVLVSLLALAASAWLACDAGAPSPAATRFPLVVLVGVDGLRGDHLGRSGYPRPTSPFLDALAERAETFERAYAASGRALTSYASLMTGLAPGEHGVWDDGAGLAAGPATLAEQMSERGYTTAAFVSTRREWFATGLTRGFDHFSPPGSLYERTYRRAAETVAEALAWLAEQPAGEPVFLWIQLEDTTKPFDPPPDVFAAALGDVADEDLIAYVLEQHRAPFGFFNYENRHVLRLLNRYDGEVRAADEALAELYSGLQAGGGAGALWVVTSPHGMGLGNHFWGGATRQIYETLVRVPLFFHTPGGELAAQRSEAVVSQLSLADALLGLVDGSEVPLDAALQGPGGGALVQRGTLPPLGHDSSRIGLPGEDPFEQDGWVEARWKLVRRADGSEELFDVAEDPYETRDRAGDAPPGELERLRAALAAELEARGIQR